MYSFFFHLLHYFMFQLPQILKEFIFLHLNHLLAHCCIFAHQAPKLYFHGSTKDADIILFALANIIHNKFVGHVWYMNFPHKFVIGNIKGVVNTKLFLNPLPLKDQDPVLKVGWIPFHCFWLAYKMTSMYPVVFVWNITVDYIGLILQV